ncbi:MAG: metallophosphoesterase, partial [Actinobacteria bacterium]|nr:metallophosphoesterase [Actinomycetota bacterium]
FSRQPRTTLFYTSDIHGSEKCFLKFVNAAKFYGAGVLVLGGDLTGKVVVPLVRQPGGGHLAEFQGQRHLIEGDAERSEFEKRVRFNGFYPVCLEQDEFELAKADAGVREQLFARVVADSVRRWVEIADERLSGTEVRCIAYPGNDDEPFVEAILSSSETIENADGRVVDLGPHELVGLGYSNPTPFNSPRELSEEQLESRLERLIGTLRAPGRSVFALHVPPVNTGLDMAPKLRRENGELRVVATSGHTVMEPVGSSAVRRVIERHQPLLGAHGHVHESRAVARLGRSVVFNPGSEYSEGVLRGALVVLEADRVVSCQLVAA